MVYSADWVAAALTNVSSTVSNHASWPVTGYLQDQVRPAELIQLPICNALCCTMFNTLAYPSFALACWIIM